MRVFTVIGNRPQFVKAAAVSDRLRTGATEVLVHTGQHYDDELSRVFFDELALPRPDHQLDVGGGTNTGQTARMLAALEPLIGAERPCTLDDVAAAEEAFIASTVRVVMPIAVVDDIRLPAAPGPVTADAAERMDRRIERELTSSVSRR